MWGVVYFSYCSVLMCIVCPFYLSPQILGLLIGVGGVDGWDGEKHIVHDSGVLL